jgi:hypothetical protein
MESHNALRPLVVTGPDGAKQTLFTNVTLRSLSDTDLPRFAVMRRRRGILLEVRLRTLRVLRRDSLRLMGSSLKGTSAAKRPTQPKLARAKAGWVFGTISQLVTAS